MYLDFLLSDFLITMVKLLVVAKSASILVIVSYQHFFKCMEEDLITCRYFLSGNSFCPQLLKFTNTNM